MASGGKDIKFGDDKRPVSIVPNDEQFLYNKASGQYLTDEFGNRLVTKVDTYFIADATMAKATSVAFLDKDDKYPVTIFSQLASGLTALCGNYEVVTALYGTENRPIVKQRDGTLVTIKPTITTKDASDNDVTWYDGDAATGLTETQDTSSETYTQRDSSLCAKWPVIRTREEQIGPRNKLYFDNLESGKGIYGLGLKFSDSLSSDSSNAAIGAASTQYSKINENHIPNGTQIIEVSHNHRVVLSNALNIESLGRGVRHNTFVDIRRLTAATRKSNATWKVEEAFKETSEVSTTLLGVSRAETQLSLFSNVSSYGLDPDEFETFSWSSTGYTVGEWIRRQNKVYGSRYSTKISEITEESGVQIGSYPVPYTYPFGPLWARLGVYNESKFNDYKNFITLGNDLYDMYSHSDYSHYPSDWKDNFLDRTITSIDTSKAPNDVSYTAGLTISFAQIDTWTDVWVKLEKGELVNPVTGLTMNFIDIRGVIQNHNKKHGTSFYDTGETSYAATTLPGYGTGERHFTQMQSRRVFRYQPGRISGFTFGVKASDESRSGYFNEWGISNPTDEYILRVRSGQLYIVRRSSIPLGVDLLRQNGLKDDAEIQVKDDISGLKASGDPFRDEEYHYVTEISTDFFNGDPLDGRGRSEYNISPSKVTMWKIEFGWYGAIGARFYAYIPVGAGDARWVVIHTLVIENKLKEPCLRDSYFRMIYRVNVTNTSTFREPQQVTKYGASYYIDGGDEGTTTIYSGDSNETKVSGLGERSLLAIRPKDVISNSLGAEIINKKMIIPTQLNITAGALTKVSTVVCKGCPGFGYVYTPGVETGTNGRTITSTGDASNLNRKGIVFTSASQIQTYAESGSADYFTVDDIGAKIIAPSINNAYIKSLPSEGKTIVTLDDGTTEDRYDIANLAGYSSGFNFSGERKVAGALYPVLDQVTGQYVEIPIGINPANVYPHNIRLSQLTGIAASPYEFSGSKIEIQFLNPQNGDDYGHFADFLIGLSKWRPVLSGGTKLSSTGNDAAAEFTNWTKNDILVPDTGVQETVGGISRNVLNPPEGEIVFGEHSQTYASVNAYGQENVESWGPQNPRVRMGIDYRIPTVSNPGGGRCSLLTIETEEPQPQDGLLYVRNGDIDANGKPTSDQVGTRQFLVMKNAFTVWPDVTYDGGELALQETLDTIDPLDGKLMKINVPQSGFYYVGEPQSYQETDQTTGGQLTYWYIEFKNINNDPLPNDSLGNVRNDGSELVVAYRPIRSYSGKQYGSSNSYTIASRRLYEFNPFPLFLIIKMRDKAAVNGITVKETIGDTTKTITPPLYFLKETIDGTEYSRATITNASGNAVRNEASTHFDEVERLSAGELENQNEAKLRSGYKVIDSIYIGEDESETIDLSDVFGADRQAIVPDNNNVEATFFVAKRIDGTNAETIANMSLNFKEQ